jgi:Protein of unknown function (DUF3604)
VKRIFSLMLIASCGTEAEPFVRAEEPLAPASADAERAAAQCSTYRALKNVYFGDLHVHTSYSLDSFGFANRNDPTAAYAFARGLRDLPLASGEGGAATATTLTPPLDFAAVTDHSEFLSLMALCGYGTKMTPSDCAALADQGSARQTMLVVTSLARLALADPPPLAICQSDPVACEMAERGAWQRNREITNAANEPCAFTALHGFEWTATTGAANLHRNVIFKSDVLPVQAPDYLSYPTPLALWQSLDATCKSADGCAALTIPHNSNLSQGQMWDTADDPVSRGYMTRYQKLVEIYQHKAASECVPGSALADASCGFEYSPDNDNAAGYVRAGLARGLELQRQTGSNPLAMGILASTDTHNGAPGYVGEQAWNGHGANQDDTAAERLEMPYYGPGGLTAVWAEENTRAAIYAALDRREVYATSGTRLRVRTYALNVPDDATAKTYCDDPSFPSKLVAAGAKPMGGTITTATAPYLFVSAMADQAPMASFDIIRLHAAGSTAQQSIKSETLSGSQRQAFCKFWKDPAFVAGAPALYYARVLEAETPRWTARDCAAAPTAAACTDSSIPKQLQERAWTSPIFTASP